MKVSERQSGLLIIAVFLTIFPSMLIAGEGEPVQPLSLEDLIRLRDEQKEDKNRKQEGKPEVTPKKTEGEVKTTELPVTPDTTTEIKSTGGAVSGSEATRSVHEGVYSPRSTSGSSHVIYPVGKEVNNTGLIELPNDGSMILSRIATVSWEKPESVKDDAEEAESGTGDKWLVATFENRRRQVQLTPRRLLKCTLLESVEKAIRENPDTRFVVTGLSTVFNKRSYLLIRSLSILEEDLIRKEIDAPDVKSEKKPEGTKMSDSARDKGRGQEADDFIFDMLRDRPGKSVLTGEMPKRDPEHKKAVPLRVKGKPLQEKSTMVANRVIRIEIDKETNWYIAKFIGDNTIRESPLRVHPSLLLKRAAIYNSEIGRIDYTKNYKISGEITSYRGHQYLLITKLIRQRHLGRF